MVSWVVRMVSRRLNIRRVPFLPAVEAGTLIAIVIIAGGVLLFSELVEMVRDEPHAFDQAVLLAFRNPADVSDPIGPAWLEIIFRDITSLGGAAVLALMTVAVTGFLLSIASAPRPVLLLRPSVALLCSAPS
jgi:undecaprenyl-diphosphatase